MKFLAVIETKDVRGEGTVVILRSRFRMFLCDCCGTGLASRLCHILTHSMNSPPFSREGQVSATGLELVPLSFNGQIVDI